MASSSSLSHSFRSSSLYRNWEHDVFPSFHGPDVRTAFLSHVLKEFRNKGIGTFIDNEIKRGESIGPELKRAIRRSKIAIVLLSRRYASSSWCLDELVEIMNCREEFGQMVMTIFYKVDPTDLKKQNGDFGKVFEDTCQGKTKERIATWTKALEGVATIAGYHSKNWVDEAAIIETIATEISKKLNIAAPSRDFDGFIRMEAHMERLESLLRLDLDDVRMIGIWGPPGIGKNTIARVLFNQISSSFQLSAIMVDIKRSYPRPCLDEYSTQLQLQSNMLSQMLNQKDMVITHLGVAQERLKGKKVLLVLDDVDRLAQLDALAGKNQWFGPGSRIVITTEDRSVLKRHGITDIYKVDFPTTDEAFQMFCMYAFGQKYPKDGFTELAQQVTRLVGDLPLALKVMGSHFRGRSKDDWTKTLPGLRRLNREIESILKFSYDVLDDEDKDLFLHITCFFYGEEIEKVVEHLKEKFRNVRQRLDVLYEKSLILTKMVGRDIHVGMHDLFFLLGRDIHRKQLLKDIHDVAGRGSVTCIYIFTEVPYINEKTFEGMSNLQFLRVRYPSPSLGLSYLSPKIQLLNWSSFPMTCLPSSVNVKFLVELKMSWSRLKKLWKGNKSLGNLKWMDLRFSPNLRKLPNLSTAISLKRLILRGCLHLVKLPSSIGNATNLQELDLHFCSSLMKLPSSVGNATNLQKLALSNCSSLMKLPSSIGNAINLQELDFSECSSLVEVPASIGNLHKLEFITLKRCSKLEVLPVNLNLKSLDRLDLSGCSSLKVFPEISTNIWILNLSGTAIEEVPSSIRTWYRLHELRLQGCKKLLSLPQLPESLIFLNAVNCESLERLDCSFSNLDINSNFSNCFRLNNDARDLIIQTPLRYSKTQVLPGKEIPICFTHRAKGGYLTKRHFPSTLEFTACILLGSKNDIQNGDEENTIEDCDINLRINEDVWETKSINPLIDHLYIFKYEAAHVTSHELFFQFSVNRSDEWMIKECRVNYGDFEGEEETNEGDSDCENK